MRCSHNCQHCACTASNAHVRLQVIEYLNISGLVIDFATSPVRTGNSFFDWLVGSSNTAFTCRMPSSQCRIIKLKSPQDRSNITCRNQRCIVMSLSCTFFLFFQCWRWSSSDTKCSWAIKKKSVVTDEQQLAHFTDYQLTLSNAFSKSV